MHEKDNNVTCTHQNYLFLQAPAPAWLCNNGSTSLRTGSSMTSLRAPMQTTTQHLLTSCSTQWHNHITSHSLINPVTTRTHPSPLKRTFPTFLLMTPFLTNMLPTPKQLPTRNLTPKTPLITLPLLLHLPTLTFINPALPTRWTLPLMTNLPTFMSPTIQSFRTNTLTRKILSTATSNISNCPTKTHTFHQLRTRRTWAGMTQQQTTMPTFIKQIPPTNLPTRMWQDPRITNRVLNFPTKTIINFRNITLRILTSTFGAIPNSMNIRRRNRRRNREARGGACRSKIRTLTSPALNTNQMKHIEATGGARPSGVSGFDPFEANKARECAGAWGSYERLDLCEVRRGVSGDIDVWSENGGREVGVTERIVGGGDWRVVIAVVGIGGWWWRERWWKGSGWRHLPIRSAHIIWSEVLLW